MRHHTTPNRCVWCKGDIPTSRYSTDPPEFFCSPKCEAKFRITSGIGSTFDIGWPDLGIPNNPSLVLVRAGQKDELGGRVFRRIKLVPRRIDEDLC